MAIPRVGVLLTRLYLATTQSQKGVMITGSKYCGKGGECVELTFTQSSKPGSFVISIEGEERGSVTSAQREELDRYLKHRVKNEQNLDLERTVENILPALEVWRVLESKLEALQDEAIDHDAFLQGLVELQHYVHQKVDDATRSGHPFRYHGSNMGIPEIPLIPGEFVRDQGVESSCYARASTSVFVGYIKKEFDEYELSQLMPWLSMRSFEQADDVSRSKFYHSVYDRFYRLSYRGTGGWISLWVARSVPIIASIFYLSAGDEKQRELFHKMMFGEMMGHTKQLEIPEEIKRFIQDTGDRYAPLYVSEGGQHGTAALSPFPGRPLLWDTLNTFGTGVDLMDALGSGQLPDTTWVMKQGWFQWSNWMANQHDITRYVDRANGGALSHRLNVAPGHYVTDFSLTENQEVSGGYYTYIHRVDKRYIEYFTPFTETADYSYLKSQISSIASVDTLNVFEYPMLAYSLPSPDSSLAWIDECIIPLSPEHVRHYGMTDRLASVGLTITGDKFVGVSETLENLGYEVHTDENSGKIYYKHKEDPVSTFMEFGKVKISLLGAALLKGDLTLAKLLLDRGAHLNKHFICWWHSTANPCVPIRQRLTIWGRSQAKIQPLARYFQKYRTPQKPVQEAERVFLASASDQDCSAALDQVFAAFHVPIDIRQIATGSFTDVFVGNVIKRNPKQSDCLAKLRDFCDSRGFNDYSLALSIYLQDFDRAQALLQGGTRINKLVLGILNDVRDKFDEEGLRAASRFVFEWLVNVDDFDPESLFIIFTGEQFVRIQSPEERAKAISLPEIVDIISANQQVSKQALKFLDVFAKMGNTDMADAAKDLREKMNA